MELQRQNGASRRGDERLARRPSEGQGWAPERPTLLPRVDIYESETEILLLADLPGVPTDAVRLHAESGELTLQADCGEEAEFGACTWRRSFLVPRGIRTEDIQAQLKDGVLRVTLPKSDQLRRRTVEVKVG